ncbi:MAG: methyltransferase domain-containing protein [Gammaproteobacteria bacterium]|nr:methyltransferase domain-containing protein [Gammaproteobacteria bacterium]
MSHPAKGSWDPARYAAVAGFVPQLGAAVFEWLAPRAGERILDLGCGDGQLTLRIATAGSRVTGVDASPEMVAAARDKGLDARLMDGQSLAFEAEFDAVFSNAALHWMRENPDAVLRGVFKALKPGGRFVAEMGGDGNIAAVERALHDELTAREIEPQAIPRRYYPSLTGYRERLERAGFEVQRIERMLRPTELPGTLADWLSMFAQEQALLLPASERDDFFAAVEKRAASELKTPAGRWVLDYVRLRFIARRPAANDQ